MPVEIKELVIRAIAEGPSSERDDERSAEPDGEARTLLIRDCVAEMMRQLRRSQEP